MKRFTVVRVAPVALSMVILTSAGCGARSDLSTARRDAGVSEQDAGADAAATCVTNRECPNDGCTVYACMDGACTVSARRDCDDADPCTRDSCDPAVGACLNEPVTLDEDGDGVNGPLPGFAAGSPGSCGDDCDDTRPRARPGGSEVCDGVDNDCDGVVDEDFDFRPDPGADAVRISNGPYAMARIGGFGHHGSSFVATYTGTAERASPWFQSFEPQGGPVIPELQLTRLNSDAYASGLVWTGSTFGVTWEDRRDGDYEIYFNRLDPVGSKLGPDLRLSQAPGFSLAPQVVWNGLEFVVIWHDRRDGNSRLYGQRIAVDGTRVGDNVALTAPPWGAEAVSVAVSPTGLGLSFIQDDGSVGFRQVSADLATLGERVVLGGPAKEAKTVWNGDRFVVTWAAYDVRPLDIVWGATLNGDGSLRTEATPLVSEPGAAVRTSTLLPLGDRLVVAYASNRTGSYELYLSTLAGELTDVGGSARPLTASGGDAVMPFLAVTDDGTLGVLFEDRRSGAPQVYLTSVRCQPELR